MTVRVARKVRGKRSSCRPTESLARRRAKPSVILATLSIELCQRSAFPVTQAARHAGRAGMRTIAECATRAPQASPTSGSTKLAASLGTLAVLRARTSTHGTVVRPVLRTVRSATLEPHASAVIRSLQSLCFKTMAVSASARPGRHLYTSMTSASASTAALTVPLAQRAPPISALPAPTVTGSSSSEVSACQTALKARHVTWRPLSVSVVARAARSVT